MGKCETGHKAGFFMPKIYDQLTKTYLDLDELADPEAYGYASETKVTDEELWGAQDPGWLERKRLSKLHKSKFKDVLGWKRW